MPGVVGGFALVGLALGAICVRAQTPAPCPGAPVQSLTNGWYVTGASNLGGDLSFCCTDLNDPVNWFGQCNSAGSRAPLCCSGFGGNGSQCGAPVTTTAEPAPETEVVESSSFNLLGLDTFILAAILAVLVLLCCALVVVFFIVRSRSQRDDKSSDFSDSRISLSDLTKSSLSEGSDSDLEAADDNPAANSGRGAYTGLNLDESDSELNRPAAAYTVLPTVDDSGMIKSSRMDEKRAKRVSLLRKTEDVGRDSLWEIPLNQIRLGEELGRGAFGVVFKTEYNGAPAALKVLQQQDGKELLDEEIAEFEDEAAILKRVPAHPNLVQFLGLCVDDMQLAILTEFCAGGSLYTLLFNEDNPDELVDSELAKTRGNEPEAILYSPEIVQAWIHGIAAGMTHLHAQGVVHRDLASRNILLSADGMTPKIADFGMSRLVSTSDGQSGGTTKATVGPLKWMSPESVSDRKFSRASDVWAFACLAFEILMLRQPYPDMINTQAATQMVMRKLSLIDYLPREHVIWFDFNDTNWADNMHKVFADSLAWQPEDRPSFETIHAALAS